MRLCCLIMVAVLASLSAARAQDEPAEGMDSSAFPPPPADNRLYLRDHLSAPPPGLCCEITYRSPAGQRRAYCEISARKIDSPCSCEPPAARLGLPPSVPINGHAVP